MKNMRDTVGLLKLISQGESDILLEKIKTQKVVFDNIERKLKEKKPMYKK